MDVSKIRNKEERGGKQGEVVAFHLILESKHRERGNSAGDIKQKSSRFKRISNGRVKNDKVDRDHQQYLGGHIQAPA